MKKLSVLVCCFVFTSMAIAACGDLTGPTSPETPINVTATLASATSVRVDWTKSPQSDGVVSYNILRNGTKVGESNTFSYTDTGLAEKTTYKYTVSANCTSGILSDASPETAAATITTADVTPPRITLVNPANGNTGVSTAGTVAATFSEPMDPTTINTTTFSLKVTATGANIPGTVTYTAATRIAEFIPTNPFPSSASITVTIKTGVKDVAGNAMTSPFTSTFTTRDDAPPTVISTSPANGATNVAPTAPITVTFSEAMDATTISASTITLRVTGSAAPVAGTVTYNTGTHVATFTPTSTLASPANFTATVSGSVKDVAGNPMGADFSFSFTTRDTTAPFVVSTSPADLALNVANNSVISAIFSKAMDPATINGTTFTLTTATGTTVAGTVAYSVGNPGTFTPTSPLASSTTYRATITTGAHDSFGIPMAANKIWTFTTADNIPPIVLAVSPGNGATNVAVTSPVNITFSEPMNATTINGTTITLKTTGGIAVSGAVTYNAVSNVATFTPAGSLIFSSGYTVTVTTGVKDLAGNAMATQFTSTFTSAAAPDTTPPTVVAVSPANGAASVAVTSPVNITFSEAMDATTINGTTVSLKTTSSGTVVSGAVTYNPATNVATFTPTGALAFGTGYTVTVTTGVKDLAGNAMAAQFTSTFATAAAPDITPPTVVSTVPTDGSTNVAINTTVTATFSEAMDATTISGTTFTLKTTIGGTPVAGTVTYDGPSKTAMFTPSSPLANNTGYTATITTGVKDVAGNAMAANKVVTFSTIVDTTPPTVNSVSPANATTGVSVGTVVTITFNEAMNATTINGTTITVKNTLTSAAVAGTVTLNVAGTVATFTLSAPLTASTGYTVTVTTGAKDLAGNSLAGTFTSTFTTAP